MKPSAGFFLAAITRLVTQSWRCPGLPDHVSDPGGICEALACATAPTDSAGLIRPMAVKCHSELLALAKVVTPEVFMVLGDRLLAGSS
jgi:hypothetical protein